MRSSISHPILHDFEGIRSHNPTKLLMPYIALKNVCTHEITLLQYTTVSSSIEGLNRPEGIPFFGAIIQL